MKNLGETLSDTREDFSRWVRVQGFPTTPFSRIHSERQLSTRGRN